MITASKLELALRCKGAFSLDHYDVDTVDAAKGRERHAEQERKINSGEIPEHYQNRWPGLSWRSEVKFAYDVASGTGRELGVGSDRDYSDARPFEICGTADAVGISSSYLVIVDKKGFDRSVSRASVNAQVHIAALALSKCLGRDSATVAIDHELRPLDVEELDFVELESFSTQVRDLMISVAAESKSVREGLFPILNEGPWCSYCPAFYSCPRKKALALETGEWIKEIEKSPDKIPSGFASKIGMVSPFLTERDAASAYEFISKIKQMTKKIDAAIYAIASKEPIRLSNGRFFGTLVKPGNEKIDGDIAYEIIKNRLGQEIADKSVTRSATKAGIKRALETAGPDSCSDKFILKEIRDSGGISRPVTSSVTEYEPE